jgi:myotubularin-related protein 1/2
MKKRTYLLSLIHWIWDQVLFLGIQNIHTMRDSLSRLRDYVDAHGSISSNGSPSAVSVVGDRVS